MPTPGKPREHRRGTTSAIETGRSQLSPEKHDLVFIKKGAGHAGYTHLRVI